jgi:CubicO group peptidase (beta-lactamase class C family)
LFHLGSKTNAITATMIARLVEAGKLSWTTTAAETFPDLSKTMDPAFRHITIEQLLSYHAGVTAFRHSHRDVAKRYMAQSLAQAEHPYRFLGTFQTCRETLTAFRLSALKPRS